MSLAIDLCILAVCVVTVIVDTRRGLIKSLMHWISTLVSLLLAYAFTPWLSAILRERLVLGGITSGISSTLKSLAASGSGDGTFNLEKLLSQSVFGDIAERYGADTGKLGELMSGQTAADGSAVDALSSAIAGPVANVISNVLAFLLIFVGTLVVLRLVTLLLDLLFSLPVLRTANRVLGFVFGVLCALLLAWALSMAASYLIVALGAIDETRFGADVLEKTVIVRFFSNNNLLAFFRNILG